MKEAWEKYISESRYGSLHQEAFEAGWKAAIEAAARKPVAYAVFHQLGGSKTLHWPEQHSENGDANDYRLVPLYAAPAQPTGKAPCERHCEANAFRIEIRGLRKRLEEVQRQWAGLTYEEICQISLDTPIDGPAFAYAIEQRLKDKNHG